MQKYITYFSLQISLVHQCLYEEDLHVTPKNIYNKPIQRCNLIYTSHYEQKSTVDIIYPARTANSDAVVHNKAVPTLLLGWVCNFQQIQCQNTGHIE